jgi:ubiquinone/menaquinone biosynthesis C-methylase UbiE
MLVKERLSAGQWVPPWLQHQHEARYEWASGWAKGATVLDAACGIGYGSRQLLAGGAARVIGMDISIDALREASNASGGMRTFACGSATTLPFPDATFDLFVSLETIEHIEDDATYLAEAARVLKSNGTFICSTPNREVLNPGRTLRDRPFNPFHVREYSIDELATILGRYFSDLSFFGQTPFARWYVGMLQRIGRRVPMAAVRLHQIRKVIGMAAERRSRHLPVPLPLDHSEPEVLIAVCRRK